MRLFGDDSHAIPDPFLRRAYELAELGRGTTSPNPVVGCVVVSDGVIVGEGYHARAGGPHAEVVALEAAADRARGATAYVTLEPCNHHGKTPPCTQALIAAGVSRVVAGMSDPNTEVGGAGAETLRQAGIEVTFAEDPAPFAVQNEEWVHWLATGLPWVRVKTALTLDGHPALARDERVTLTGSEARGITMRLRAQSDAVVVGAHTAEIDDPSLLVRGDSGRPVASQPLRVVLARNAVPEASMFEDGHGRAVALLPREWAHAAPRGAEVLSYDARLGVRGALYALAREGVVSALVEAGPGMLTALWQTGLIDELVLYHAGGMAGAAAPPAFYGGPTAHGDDLDRPMVATEGARVGEDFVTVWRPRAARRT